MDLVCLDLEGVLVPEIWIQVAEISGVEELKKTTRDISDYDELMQMRLQVLREHRIGIEQIHKAVSLMDPLPGAVDFLDELRANVQVVILSDTYIQFAGPLLAKLKYPTLFCNDLIIGSGGGIENYRLRQKNGKKKAVQAFKDMNLEITAAGDSYNDLTMLKAADRGILFRPPETISREFPEFPVCYEYSSLLTNIFAPRDNTKTADLS